MWSFKQNYEMLHCFVPQFHPSYYNVRLHSSSKFCRLLWWRLHLHFQSKSFKKVPIFSPFLLKSVSMWTFFSDLSLFLHLLLHHFDESQSDVCYIWLTLTITHTSLLGLPETTFLSLRCSQSWWSIIWKISSFFFLYLFLLLLNIWCSWIRKVCSLENYKQKQNKKILI